MGSEQAESICQNASELGLSIVFFPEVISALSRKVRDKVITWEVYEDLKNSVLEDIEDAEIINLTPGVLETTTALLEINSLQSLDAVHIACAIEWNAELFVSSDERQVAATENSGLVVKLIEGIRPGH